jgi:hypothetical protein
MISSNDIITFWLTPEEEERVTFHASQCTLGGRSNIRGTNDRQNNLNEDQLYGQCCELAGWMSFYGREDGLFLYNASREIRNADPWASDNGNDIDVEGITTPIDVKGSHMRYSEDPLFYNLVYPTKEHNDETLYILSLARHDTETMGVPRCVAHVVGFVVGHDMPPAKDFKGFGIRRWIPATRLCPMSELVG